MDLPQEVEEPGVQRGPSLRRMEAKISRPILVQAGEVVSSLLALALRLEASGQYRRVPAMP